MKKYLILGLLVLVISWTPSMSYAQTRTFEVDGINYRVIKEPDGSMATGTVSVCPLEYGEYEGEIVIPNVVRESDDQYADKYKVVGIDEGAFAQTKYLKSVKLPPSIETIGDNAFRFSSVEKVELPMGNLTAIGRYVFAQTELASIDVPSTVKVVGENAFSECYKLSNVVLHEGIKSIEKEAFYSCKNLETIHFPNSLSSIGNNAFNSCGRLAIITGGGGLKRIGDGALGSCLRLRNITLPEGIREIGEGAFAASGIVEITIPKSIKVLKEKCFAGSMLRRITLPTTLVAIEDYVFMYCLIDTIIVSSTTSVSPTALMTETEVLEMMEKALGEYEEHDNGDAPVTATESESKEVPPFYIPKRGKEYDKVISKYVKKPDATNKLILDYSNVDYSASGEIVVNNIVYTPISYPLKDEEYGILVVKKCESVSGKVIIPGVIEISGGPYPEKYIVAGIGNAAFDGKKDVTSIDVPSTISAFGIGMSAFRRTGITEFVLPEDMEVIPSGLLGDSYLSKITLPKKLKKIEAYAFSMTELKEIVVPEGVTVIGKHAFANCNQLSKVILPSTIKIIEDNAFSGCHITEIEIPESIEEIGYNCFRGCQLKNLRVPKGLKKIGLAAFKCDGLVNVEICGNPCDWSIDKGGYYNHLFGDNPQLKIQIKDAKYASCPLLEEYSSKIALGKQNAGQKQKDSPLSEYVDLGLPSGTLWATCNVGAKTPEDYGDYYAWGETIGLKDGKKEYDARTHKYLSVQGQNLYEKKYCLNDYFGEIDSLYTLLPEDDVATVKLGKDWRMPTKDEMEELVKECQWNWLKISNDVSGYLVTGPNGNTIFLPAAGYYDKISDGNNVAGLNDYLYYWTSEQNHQGPMALDNSLISDRNSRYGVRNGQLSTTFKWRGCSVRPVRKK